MMPFDLWLPFTLASITLLLIPGPTVLLVLSYSLSQGRKVALASAAGVALGDLVAMSLSLAGLGALVATSATLFTLLKWIGAAYLLWLGIKLIRSGPGQELQLPQAAMKARGIFWHTALVTALNPKSIGFFIAFVPQFMTPQSPLLPQCAIMIMTFVSLAALNALAYALTASHMRQLITKPKILLRITRCGGAALITMAALTVTMRRLA